MKKLLVLSILFSFFSCDNENLNLDEKSTESRSSVLDNSSKISLNTTATATAGTDDDYIFRRKLIELEAEYNRCIGNPAFGYIVKPPTQSIDSQVTWNKFKSNISQSLNTSFSGAWGLYVNQKYFTVPIIRTREAMPSSYDFYIMKSSCEGIPCYLKYLQSVESLTYGSESAQ